MSSRTRTRRQDEERLQSVETTTVTDVQPAPRLADLKVALLVGLAVFLVYVANGRRIGAGDSLGTRLVPFAVLRTGTVLLDDFEDVGRIGHPNPYWLRKAADGRTASLYPVATPLLVTPLYVPAFLRMDAAGYPPGPFLRTAAMMEKLAASVVASVAASLVFLLVRRRLSRSRALLLTAAFALGTSTWVISSQALWQHGAAEMLLALGLLAITAAPTRLSLAVAGLASGLLVANRPPDAVFAAAIGLTAILAVGRRSWPFFAAAAAPVVLTLWYNLATFGTPGGGYGTLRAAPLLSYPLVEGVAGLLISPGRGLFVWSPFLLFLALRAKFRRDPGEPPVLAAGLAAGFLVLLVVYGLTDFRGGHCYGPRFLLDTLPALVFLLVPVVARLERPGLLALAAAAAFGISIQVVGAFCYPNGMSDIDLDPWRTFPPVVEARAGAIPISYRAFWNFD